MSIIENLYLLCLLLLSILHLKKYFSILNRNILHGKQIKCIFAVENRNVLFSKKLKNHNFPNKILVSD